MLYDVNSEKEITTIPHRQDYDRWRNNLSEQDFQMIFDDLNNRIDQEEIHTSSWMPGHDWSDTVYHPIYLACNKDTNNAAKFFGLILWEVMLERPEYWSFGRYKKEGINIEGLTYFRVEVDSI